MYPKSISRALLSAAIVISTFSTASAEKVKIGNLIIENPVARATAPGAKVAGGYLKITNTGPSADRLTGGSSTFADTVQVHQMSMENDVMKMSEVEGGLNIPAGETVILKPGGLHIMFMKLEEALKAGEQRRVQLNFSMSGSVDVIFDVKSIADTMKLKHSH